ncbi:histone deacetylase clr3 [Moniliophthora roreri]|uniref:histone deacetylase n=1 Tax=Moniliophthora roreri TaxID=221103 RepID=A0A0W0FGY7_MONRR|nr:histone deacetylase clr3 [Moniliophthora roreri]
MDMDVDPVPGPSNVSEPEPAQSSPPRESEQAVGYVYSAEMTNHFKASGHHEDPRRITRIWELVLKGEYHMKMKSIPIRPVKKQEILLVHSEDHWDKVLAIEHMTPQQIIDSEEYYEQLSLYVMQGTTRAACLSCGGTIEACLAVARGELQKAFAIVRPPGHHAEPDEHMGFCFFNNVAVAARVIQQTTNIKKILILDWDVHHGNGTQRAFYDDPTILYISLHRYEGGTFYPCGPFGALQSCGEGEGLGYSINIPWPEKGMGDADYLHAFHKVVMPIAMEFAPEMVIISAGFDAAQGDELGECLVSPAGYAHMTHMLSSLAGGRLAVGGYNIESSANSAIAVLKVVLGEAPNELPPLTASEAGTETVWLVAKEQSKYWKSVDPKACEPREEVEAITFSIPEILKAHRQHYLYTEHGMMQVPLLGEELDKKFSSQIICSQDLFENNTMIVFAHEFGNLRTELESKTRCDVNLERSYLIDFSKELVAWIKKEGYSLLDVNIFPKPFTAQVISRRSKSAPDVGKQIITYLWDNYIQLSSAQNIILIGHGPGCYPIMELIENRTNSIGKTVKAVIQVVGHTKVPIVPKDSDLRDWYTKHSYVVLPHNHRILGPETKPKDLRRHGSLCPIEESQPIKLIMRALPGIQGYIKATLGQNANQDKS